MGKQRSECTDEAQAGPRMTAELQAPTRSLGSWTVGVVGIAGLSAIIAGVYASPEALVVVGIVIAVAVGIGWPHFLRIPAKKTLAAVIALPGAGAAVAAGLVPAPGYLDWTPGFVALGMMAVFVVQLIRGTGQAQRLESTLGCCAGVLLSCLGAGWIAGSRFNGVREMLLVAAISAAVAPLAGLVLSDIAVLPAAIFGVVVGAVLASFRRLVTLRGAPLNLAAALGMGLAPVSAIGSLAYFIDKLLIY